MVAFEGERNVLGLTVADEIAVDIAVVKRICAKCIPQFADEERYVARTVCSQSFDN